MKIILSFVVLNLATLLIAFPSPAFQRVDGLTTTCDFQCRETLRRQQESMRRSYEEISRIFDNIRELQQQQDLLQRDFQESAANLAHSIRESARKECLDNASNFLSNCYREFDKSAIRFRNVCTVAGMITSRVVEKFSHTIIGDLVAVGHGVYCSSIESYAQRESYRRCRSGYNRLSKSCPSV